MPLKDQFGKKYAREVIYYHKNPENPPHCHVPLIAWISMRSEAIESFDNDVFSHIEAKRTRSIV
jgi:hypothetical protein